MSKQSFFLSILAYAALVSCGGNDSGNQCASFSGDYQYTLTRTSGSCDDRYADSFSLSSAAGDLYTIQVKDGTSPVDCNGRFDGCKFSATCTNPENDGFREDITIDFKADGSFTGRADLSLNNPSACKGSYSLIGARR